MADEQAVTFGWKPTSMNTKESGPAVDGEGQDTLRAILSRSLDSTMDMHRTLAELERALGCSLPAAERADLVAAGSEKPQVLSLAGQVADHLDGIQKRLAVVAESIG